MTETYQKIVATGVGAPDVLAIRQEALPEPGRGDVRVKILMTGVAFADIMIREGSYAGMPKPPVTPGYDFIGRVDKLGTGTDIGEGQIVAALTGYGSYAEYRTYPATDLIPVPDDLDLRLAACLPLNYVTAYQMLHRFAKLKPGDAILVHGAAGGVGTALIELAKLANLTVYGTASARKHDLIQAAGAIPIDYRTEDFVERVQHLHGGKVNAVFDHIGIWKHARRSYNVLVDDGQLIVYGFAGTFKNGRPVGSALTIPLSYLALKLMNFLPGKSVAFYLINQVKKQHPDWYREDLTTLFNFLKEDKIHPLLAEVYPLKDARKAHERLGKSAVQGKIILVCNGTR